MSYAPRGDGDVVPLGKMILLVGRDCGMADIISNAFPYGRPVEADERLEKVAKSSK